MFKFTYSDKSIYVKLIRMIMRCFCYLKINKHNVRRIHNFLYKILLPFKDKGIKLFSNRENCFYFCPYRDINRFIEGADFVPVGPLLIVDEMRKLISLPTPS